MLKELFKAKGIKQKWFAKKLGVSEVTVSNWVQQKTTPTELHLKKISELVGVPIEQLKMFYGKY